MPASRNLEGDLCVVVQARIGKSPFVRARFLPEGLEERHGNRGRWHFGLLILIADIWAIVNVVRSAASTGRKVLWVLLILILPVIGLIIWLLAGPRTARSV